MRPNKVFFNPDAFVKVTIAICFILLSIGSNGQDPFQPMKVIQPSPTAASLGSYGNNPVSYYSGTTGVTIPLYEIKTNSHSLPINLSYFTKGVRVADNASWVGLGWSLSAGGVITKSVRGRDDLYGTGSTAIGYYNAGEIPSKFSVLGVDYLSLSTQIQNYLWNFDQGWIDTDPDIFNYNFGNYSGKFVLGKLADGSITYMDQKNNLKITYAQPTDSWLVIDPVGYKYYFGTHDREQDYSSSSTLGEMLNDAQIGAFDNFTINAPDITTGWYLDSIVAPTTEAIRFTYTINQSQSESLISKSEEEYDMLNMSTSNANGFVPTFGTTYHRYSASKQVFLDAVLKQITFAQGSVQFITTARDDMEYLGSAIPGKLSQVIIQDNNNNTIRSYDLYYSDFMSATSTGLANDYTNRRRLKLDSIQEVGSDGKSIPPYKFTYFNANDIPYKYTKAIDHWGYYNGATNNTTLLPAKQISATGQYWTGADRSADQVDADLKKGVLSSVTYPTGGMTNFDYELNDYTNLTGDDMYALVPQYYIASTMLQTYSVSFDIPVIDTPVVVFHSNFKKNGDLSYVGDYAHIYKNGNLYYSFSETTLQPSGFYTNPQTSTFMLPPGHYTMDVRNLDGITMSLYANWNHRVLLTQKKGGGLRVNSIINTDNGNVVSVRKIKYTKADGSSTGLLISPQMYDFHVAASDYIGDNGNAQAGSDGNQAVWNFDYLCRMSNSIFQPGISCNVGDVGYDMVTELSGANGENGRIEYYYTNNPDISPAVNIPYVPAIHDPLNGKLYKTIAYDASGNVLKRNEYQYSQQQTVYLPGLTKYPKIPAQQIPAAYQQYVPTSELKFYNIPAYWTVLSSEKETLNDQNLDSIVRTTNYYYTNYTYPNLTRSETVKSNGMIAGSYLYYPQDYPAGTGFIDDMFNAHILSKPIETVKYQTDRSGNTSITGGVITTYKAGGKGLADQVNMLETTQAISSDNFKFSTSTAGTPTAISTDPHYANRLTFDNYDNYGNLMEQAKSNDLHESYIWDYNNQSPIAKVTNAAVSDIAYTSFEADGTGNWVLGSTSRNASAAITGSGAYTLNSDISKSGLTSSTTYVVSYWTLNASPFSIPGTISGYPVKGKTINGWTLYVHRVTGQNTVSLSGSGLIDELRLYPLGAQMTTYTYTPLVGITNQCDVGNRVTYYEYDGFQRLKRIRDQDHNILKTFDYQYQYAGCGANCYAVPMQTLAGTNTISYPVGVFNVHGNLLGNATGPSQYVSLWNNDTSDVHLGSLSTGNDSLHFNMTLQAGKNLPAGVTGCRYYQMDMAWNLLDGVRNYNGAYIDFGDGTGMHMGKNLADTPAVIAPNTTFALYSTNLGNLSVPGLYFFHTYRDSSMKTLTFYHNDGVEESDLDNQKAPAGGLTRLKNLRGNLPQNTNTLGGSSYQQPTMTTVAGISNWNQLHSIQYFRLNNGDGLNPCEHIGYAQDFMSNNPGLLSINTTWAPYRTGVRDTTFKLSRLKSNWNTYFTNLQYLSINDDHWNREDLSALRQLNVFFLWATTQDHQDDPNSPLIPIPPSAIDNMLNQIAAGAGQTVSNGLISIVAGGTNRSFASDQAVSFLKSKGWKIALNNILL
jgi:hypothetical protein